MKEEDFISHLIGVVKTENYLNGELIEENTEEIDKELKWENFDGKVGEVKKQTPTSLVGRVTIYDCTDGNATLIQDEEKVFIIQENDETEKPKKENKIKESLGIGLIDPYYIEANELQEKAYELKKIDKFLNKYISFYAEDNGLNADDITLDFINYGKTELVYVLTEPSGKKVTVLTKQPAVEFGKVKQEADYLTQLKQVDENVVAPIDYFKFGDQELYVTPYVNQARCVASYDTWGMYVPEPYYRFENFTREQEQVVNTCMIAKLVSLYDFNNQEGISKCKIGGGDFMLPKGWENETPTIENTLNSLYLIAAREKINCSFDEYLDIIRDEFSRETITEDQESLKINLRGRVAMEIGDIENGIELGKELIEERNSSNIDCSEDDNVL